MHNTSRIYEIIFLQNRGVAEDFVCFSTDYPTDELFHIYAVYRRALFSLLPTLQARHEP